MRVNPAELPQHDINEIVYGVQLGRDIQNSLEASHDLLLERDEQATTHNKFVIVDGRAYPGHIMGNTPDEMEPPTCEEAVKQAIYTNMIHKVQATSDVEELEVYLGNSPNYNHGHARWLQQNYPVKHGRVTIAAAQLDGAALVRIEATPHESETLGLQIVTDRDERILDMEKYVIPKNVQLNIHHVRNLRREQEINEYLFYSQHEGAHNVMGQIALMGELMRQPRGRDLAWFAAAFAGVIRGTNILTIPTQRQSS